MTHPFCQCRTFDPDSHVPFPPLCEKCRADMDTARERDRLREALAWAVGFIRCYHPNAGVHYEDMRNAVALAEGGPGMFGEFHRLSCRAEAAEDRVRALEQLLRGDADNKE